MDDEDFIIYLVVPEFGYHADIRVAFEDEDLADTHVDELIDLGINAIKVPVTFQHAPPASKPWYSYTSNIRANGMVERTDVYRGVEWDYEEPMCPLPVSTTIQGTSKSGYLVHTIGYDNDGAAMEHNDKVRELGGFVL